MRGHTVRPAPDFAAAQSGLRAAISGWKSMLRFKCTSCGEWHEGVPGYAAEAPLYYYSIPVEERAQRCNLGSDTCIVDQEVDISSAAAWRSRCTASSEPFIWGVWVSLSDKSFRQFMECFDAPERSHIGPFFGWLSAELPCYPSTENLKTRVHLRDNGVRPFVELEPTDHPLAVEQRTGITAERGAEIYSRLEHRLH